MTYQALLCRDHDPEWKGCMYFHGDAALEPAGKCPECNEVHLWATCHEQHN